MVYQMTYQVTIIIKLKQSQVKTIRMIAWVNKKFYIYVT